jgi:hypothetical protein
MNIAFVKSDFQLLSAIEYSLQNKVKIKIYFFGKNNSSYLTKLKDQLKDLDIIFLKQGYLSFMYCLIFFFKISILKKVQLILIGDNRVFEFLLYRQILNPISSLLIDDGLGSIFGRYLNKQSKPYNFNANSKTKFLSKLLIKPFSHDYFTCFKLPSEKDLTYSSIKFHQFKSISTFFYSNIKKNESANYVHFIGQCISESKIISLECELEKIFSYKKQIMTNNQILIYLAHPRDSDRKLNLIKQNGIKVLINDSPLEVKVLEGEFKLSNITSFYSSSIITLTFLTKISNVSIIPLEKEIISNIHYEEVSYCQKAITSFQNINYIK